MIFPVIGRGIAALALSGPKVTRIAAAGSSGSWSTQELRKPVKVASPLIRNDVAVYALGRYLYAFSALTTHWAVLELPEGIPASRARPSVSGSEVRVEAGGHIYTFSSGAKAWTDLDLNSILNRPDSAGTDAPTTGSGPG